MKAPPGEVKLSREDGEALIERLQADTLTGDDRRLSVKRIRVYFWFTFALSETKISLKRPKRALSGGSKPPPPSPPAGGRWQRQGTPRLSPAQPGTLAQDLAVTLRAGS